MYVEMWEIGSTDAVNVVKVECEITSSAFLSDVVCLLFLFLVAAVTDQVSKRDNSINR